MIRLRIIESKQIKRTRYEAVQDLGKENKYWVLKIAQSGKVDYLQPARTEEGVLKFFNKIINNRE
jgi:hypothetical protein